MSLVSMHVVEYAICLEQLVLKDRIWNAARLLHVPLGSVSLEEAGQCPIAISNP